MFSIFSPVTFIWKIFPLIYCLTEAGKQQLRSCRDGHSVSNLTTQPPCNSSVITAEEGIFFPFIKECARPRVDLGTATNKADTLPTELPHPVHVKK